MLSSPKYPSQALPWPLVRLLLHHCPPCPTCQTVRKEMPCVCDAWDSQTKEAKAFAAKHPHEIAALSRWFTQQVRTQVLDRRMVHEQHYPSYVLLEESVLNELKQSHQTWAPVHLAWAQYVLQALQISKVGDSPPHHHHKNMHTLVQHTLQTLSLPSLLPVSLFRITRTEWTTFVQSYQSFSRLPTEVQMEEVSVEEQLMVAQHSIQSMPFLHQQRLLYALQYTLTLPLPFCLPLTLPMVLLPVTADPHLETRVQQHFRLVEETTKHPGHPSHPFRRSFVESLENKNSYDSEQDALWALVFHPEHDRLIPIADALRLQAPAQQEAICIQLMQQLMVWWYWMFYLFSFLHGNVQEDALYVRIDLSTISTADGEGRNESKEKSSRRFYSFKDLDHWKERNEEGVWIDHVVPWVPVWTCLEYAHVSGQVLRPEVRSGSSSSSSSSADFVPQRSTSESDTTRPLNPMVLVDSYVDAQGKRIFPLERSDAKLTRLHSQELFRVLKFSVFALLQPYVQDLFEHEKDPNFVLHPLDILRRLPGVTPQPVEYRGNSS